MRFQLVGSTVLCLALSSIALRAQQPVSQISSPLSSTLAGSGEKLGQYVADYPKYDLRYASPQPASSDQLVVFRGADTKKLVVRPAKALDDNEKKLLSDYQNELRAAIQTIRSGKAKESELVAARGVVAEDWMLIRDRSGCSERAAERS